MDTKFSEKERKKLIASGIDPDRFSIQEQQDMKEWILPAFKRLIEICGDDPSREGMEDTPFRTLKAFLEYTKGYATNPADHLATTFPAQNQDLVLVRDIEFFSLCEHHMERLCI